MFNDGKTLVAGDVALFVSETGKPDGPPILLVHGGLGSREDFAPLAAGLEDEYRLIAIDSRGHGRSTIGAAPMTYRQMEHDTAAVVDQLGLTDAGIIGHSDGGIIALRLAASGVVRPRFVVTAGAHWSLPDQDPTRGLFRSLTVAIWRTMFGPQVARYETENPEPDFARLFDAARSMWLGTGPDSYPGETVGRITAPLLVVHGDADSIVSRVQACELAERVEGARLFNLPFASHSVLEETPGDVLPVLRDFISSTRS